MLNHRNTYTIAEALTTRDRLTDIVADLLVVAASDVSDDRGDKTLSEVFNPGNLADLNELYATEPGRRVRRLAHALVDRLVYEDDIEWHGTN